jgi:hypothetical protein
MTYVIGNTGTAAGGGGVVAAKTGDYTVQSGDANTVILVDSTSAGFTVTLPTAAAGFKVTIEDATGACASKRVVVTAPAGVAIAGFTDGYIAMFTAFEAVTLVSDGTGWYILGANNRVACLCTWGQFAGGYWGGYVSNMYKINIAVLSNATDFGYLTATKDVLGGTSGYVRAVYGGGLNSSAAAVSTIDYVATTTGCVRGTSFGFLTVSTSRLSASANETTGLWLGGRRSSSASNVIELITLAIASNSTDFGDLTVKRERTSAMGSPIKAFCCGGYDNTSTTVNTVDVTTYSSGGGASDFGDLTVARYYSVSCSNKIRGVTASGLDSSQYNVIDYVDISGSPANYSDYGDLSSVRDSGAAVSSRIRAVFYAGYSDVSFINTIEYVSLTATPPVTVTDFGDALAGINYLASSSNGHGGLL